MKKSKSLNFVSKEKFLKNAGIKGNHKNMMESNGEILSGKIIE